MAKAGRRETIIPAPSSEPLHVTSTGLNELLALSPDALLAVDQAGTIVLANEQASALFGYSGEEFRGRRLDALLPAHLRAAHATHRQHYFTAPRTRSMGAGLHLAGRRKDSSEFPVDISLRPVLLGEELLVVGAIRDMSEQGRAEREHTQQAEQLRLQSELIALSHDGILVRDPVSRVLFWNKGAERLYGWTAREALGRISHSLLRTRFPKSRADVETHLAQEGYWEGELVHTCRDGSVVTVECRQALVCDVQGHRTAVLEINRDITARRRLEHAAQAEYSETTAHLAFLQEVLECLAQLRLSRFWPGRASDISQSRRQQPVGRRVAARSTDAGISPDQRDHNHGRTGTSPCTRAVRHAARGWSGGDYTAAPGDHPSSEWVGPASAGQRGGAACAAAMERAVAGDGTAAGDTRVDDAGRASGRERPQGSRIPQRRVHRGGSP